MVATTTDIAQIDEQARSLLHDAHERAGTATRADGYRIIDDVGNLAKTSER